jgi:hypothetical protein
MPPHGYSGRKELGTRLPPLARPAPCAVSPHQSRPASGQRCLASGSHRLARVRERKVSSIRLVGVPGAFAKVARETQRDGVVSGLVAAGVSAGHRCFPSIDRAATNPDTIHVANSHIWSTGAY